MKTTIVLLAALMGSVAAQAQDSVEIIFTDADVVQSTGGVPSCIVELPSSTFVLVAPCSAVMPDVTQRFSSTFPDVPYTITLNGTSLSGV